MPIRTISDLYIGKGHTDMVDALKGLQPERLWHFFGELSKIPRGSKNEAAVLTWLEKYAVDKAWKYRRDRVGNLCLEVPATAGYEDSPVLVLQAHVDMVCEKNKDVAFDFEKDALKLKTDGKWVMAEGTTLGADNGIGLAAALAIADSADVAHGPLELLLTVDEETGLTGAKSLEPGFVKGRVLLNLDSEELGVLYVGCAGGLDTEIKLPVAFEPAPAAMKAATVSVRGLTGGHSGLNIHEGRGNAIKILNRTLSRLVEEARCRVGKIHGGSKRNAIPREAEAEIYLDANNLATARDVAAKMTDMLRKELPSMEKGIEISVAECAAPAGQVMKVDSARRAILLTAAIPCGVIGMSPDIKDLVETSSNLGVIATTATHVVYTTSQRSSVDSAKADLGFRMRAISELAGAECVQGSGYPGWKPNLNSSILQLSRQVWKVIYNSEPQVKAIHAGLECGIIGERYHGMDMISFGPTITGAHSPAERVEIDSVARFYTYAKLLVKMAAESNN